MTLPLHRKRWLLAAALLLLLASTVALFRGWWAGTSSAASQSASGAASPAKPPAKALPPAARLRILVGESKEPAKKLLDPAFTGWHKAKPTAIVLSRTPRIYQTEPATNRPAPACEVRAVRAAGKLYLRIQWEDATKNAPRAAPVTRGVARHSPRRPTGHTSAFADAAAVMVPTNWTGPSFPSLLMGDKKTPARLYYWNASYGAEELTASGRATPQRTGESFPHRAWHDGKGWVLTLAFPDLPKGYPVAFAVWDGQFGDRDGLKFFSIWYVIVSAGSQK
jgi:DMSO reductase family type II enzyme heme b subunit